MASACGGAATGWVRGRLTSVEFALLCTQSLGMRLRRRLLTLRKGSVVPDTPHLNSCRSTDADCDEGDKHGCLALANTALSLALEV